MPETCKNACEVRDLTFRYFEQAKRNILEDVNLAFPKGGVTVILGASGCGKSTLASLLCGLFPENGGHLESGTVLVDGEDVLSLEHHARCRKIAQMFQNPDLQFCMRNLREELYFCMENLRIPQADMPRLLADHARRFHAEALLDRPFHLLSGGEKQRAALCCLFLLRPEVLVLDEPFANLDGTARQQYLQLLREYLREEPSATVIAIDHRAENWLDLADRYLVLGTGGSLLKEIPAADLPREREFLVGAGLNDPFRTARAASAPDSRQDLSGGDTSSNESRPALLELRGASVFHKKASSPQLSGLDLTAGKGEMIACLGPSGSGKTTLFMALLGQKKYKGSIRLSGSEISKIKSRDLFRRIGIVFQNPANQFVTTSVQAEVEVSLRNRPQNGGAPRQKSSPVEEIPAGRPPRPEEQAPGTAAEKRSAPASASDPPEERALELLEEFDLRHYRRYSPFMLSQGQQRRLGVLTMLAGGQTLLLLDEPTYGQDGRSCAAIMERLKALAGQGITVIFSTHDRALASEYADRFWLVEGGTAHETR